MRNDEIHKNPEPTAAIAFHAVLKGPMSRGTCSALDIGFVNNFNCNLIKIRYRPRSRGDSLKGIG